MIPALDMDGATISNGSFVLRNISLRVAAGEYVMLLGKNGAGKTSLMESICGLLPITGGTISICGRDVTRLCPSERNIGYVAQEVALFPTMPVRRNLDFPLRLRRWPGPKAKQRIDELAALLDLGSIMNRMPQSLSGGEAQRVAIGRALSFYPALLCLDEPLSALDPESRSNLLHYLASLKATAGATVLHITHNHSEAQLLGSRVFSFANGELRAIDSIPVSATSQTETAAR